MPPASDTPAIAVKNHQILVKVDVQRGADHAKLASYVSRRGRPSSAGTESANDEKQTRGKQTEHD